MQTAPDVFILAATHFDEVALVTCLSGLRGEGITTVLITPTPGLLNGKRGITLRPDLSLAQISDFVVKDRQMVIIAGVPNRPRLPSLTLAPTNCCSTFWPLAARLWGCGTPVNLLRRWGLSSFKVQIIFYGRKERKRPYSSKNSLTML